MEELCATKIMKYESLGDVVSQHCEEVYVYPIIIGSTGLIHQRTL